MQMGNVTKALANAWRPRVLLGLILILMALKIVYGVCSRVFPSPPPAGASTEWEFSDLRDYLRERGVSYFTGTENNSGGHTPAKTFFFFNQNPSTVSPAEFDALKSWRPLGTNIEGLVFVRKTHDPERAQADARELAPGCWAWGEFVFRGDPKMIEYIRDKLKAKGDGP